MSDATRMIPEPTFGYGGSVRHELAATGAAEATVRLGVYGEEIGISSFRYD